MSRGKWGGGELGELSVNGTVTCFFSFWMKLLSSTFVNRQKPQQGHECELSYTGERERRDEGNYTP